MSPRALAWKPTTERRTRRSTHASTAASLYLERVRERCALDAIALRSRDSGGISVRVASEISGTDGSALAQIGVGVLDGDVNAGIEGMDVFAHAVTIGSEECVLVSAGGRVDRVKTIASDLSRILA